MNPAAAVRGPKHVVTKGATPVLSPAGARKLLENPGDLLAHVSPLGWEHINLTGEYRWPGAPQGPVADGGTHSSATTSLRRRATS